MRIAFITFEYPPFIIGGAGIYALNITRELAKLGHQVVVFTPGVSENKSKSDLYTLKIQNVSINKKLPFKALQFWLRLPSEIKKVGKNNQFDIIHFNGISYWFLKKRLSRAKHIVTVHHLVKDAIKNTNLSFISRMKDISGENSFFMSFLEKKCIKSPDKLVAVSNFTKKQIIESYDIDPTQIEVIYNGIDLNGYSFPEYEIITTKRQLGLSEKPVILFVGRVDDPRKGLDLLLESVKQVLQKLDVSLLVIGKGDQTKARVLAKSLGILDNILFIGFVDEITLKKCYALCDVYVVPSRLEGFGLTILEAMAAEKPVVATNVGAISELIQNGENGKLVELNDVTGLANAIYSSLISQKTGEDIGKTNTNYIAQKFCWGTNAKEIVKIYLQCLQ